MLPTRRRGLESSLHITQDLGFQTEPFRLQSPQMWQQINAGAKLKKAIFLKQFSGFFRLLKSFSNLLAFAKRNQRSRQDTPIGCLGFSRHQVNDLGKLKLDQAVCHDFVWHGFV
jgi:hypothetical protein